MLAALPITVPAFVTSYSWVSITPAVQGFWGAAGIVTLAYYPLVYLPVAAVLRGTDPALEESARSLGMGPWRTFFRVTLPQTRVALLGGMLLVAVHMLSEFGAFAMLRFQTFTTAIYDQYKLSFDGAAASMLASVLVLLCLVLLVTELAARGRGRYARVDSGAARPIAAGPPRPGAGGPSAAASPALIGLALGLPLATLVYWVATGAARPSFDLGALLAATGTSLKLGLGAAALTTLLALPISVLSVRHPSRTATADRARHLPPLRPAGDRRRALADRALDPLLPGALRHDPAADRRLRDPLAAAGAGRHPGGAGAGAAGPRGGRPLARLPAARGDGPGHPAAHPARPRRRGGARLPRHGDRADRDPAAGADRHPDAGDAVLGQGLDPLLRSGGPLRCPDGRDLRRSPPTC